MIPAELLDGLRELEKMLGELSRNASQHPKGWWGSTPEYKAWELAHKLVALALNAKGGA